MCDVFGVATLRRTPSSSADAEQSEKLKGKVAAADVPPPLLHLETTELFLNCEEVNGKR